MHRASRSNSALTLIELIIAMALISFVTAAVTSAFVAGIGTERTYAVRAQQQNETVSLQRHITQELQGAILADEITDAGTYFVGEIGNAGTGSGNGGTSTTPATTTNTSTGSSTGGPADAASGDLGCDRITFTTTEPPTPISIQANTDDFETQQQKNGPVGGTTEVSLSTTAVGTPTTNNTGLYERIQQPSDADATQGGNESLLSADVKSIGFQFWDGAEWVEQWDSTIAPDLGRLPAAVLVSYILNNDTQNKVHEFMVAIPASNVTTTNPITQTSTGATP